MRILVSRLGPGMTDAMLRPLLEPFGDVDRVTLAPDPKDPRYLHAVVYFNSTLAADAACAGLNGSRFQGRMIEVRPWHESDAALPPLTAKDLPPRRPPGAFHPHDRPPAGPRPPR